jgi:hypothetical protein
MEEIAFSPVLSGHGHGDVLYVSERDRRVVCSGLREADHRRNQDRLNHA